MEGQDEVSAREQHFHSQVRESTICFLLFAILYVVSYFIITRYKRKSDEQEDEDAIVNRISSLVMATLLSSRLFLSTFTLAVSAGAVLLLPFSIISNEILLSFPQNYYIQWLNGSLIHGLWNLASLFSNLCLFVLMPFAFFFLESEGFAGLKKGIRARILETLVMLLLLALLILGIVWVASALIDNDAASMESLYDLWEFYLPYLYSCISLMGCLLLLLCTPVGLSRMFTVMGQLLVKPTILEDLDEQIYIITLEEEALQRRLNGLSSSVEYNIMELEQELENVKTLKTKLDPWSSFSVLQSPVWHFAAQTPANIVSPDSHFMLSTQGMSWAQLVFLLPASRPGNSQDSKLGQKGLVWFVSCVSGIIVLPRSDVQCLENCCLIICVLFGFLIVSSWMTNLVPVVAAASEVEVQCYVLENQIRCSFIFISVNNIS
ncbi:limb region 1 protein homolog isoform X13 [Pan paniscus]|uniref:limb region 1 protein homolog isoform X13 n=1 Tax=Pan paniscus TaxID=9597 RepID=UPI0015604B70|nr:limb region 1 protein homolog isoform X12 [Pan paniscus]